MPSLKPNNPPLDLATGAPEPLPGAPTPVLPVPPTRYELAAWALTAVALVYVLELHLLPALLGGLLVYQMVHLLAPRIPAAWMRRDWAKLVVVALLSVLIIAILTLMTLGVVAFFRGGGGGDLQLLLQKMVDAFETHRHSIPAWMSAYLPDGTDALKAELIEWLQKHAKDLQLVGQQAGRTFAYILIGMVLGAMVSLRQVSPQHTRRPFSAALLERAARLSDAFHRVVFAQVRIAALNTLFTWLYLSVLLPMTGNELPLTKTLLAVTFFCGLLPVVGNLISNTVIVLVSLNHSVGVAAISLGYLIIIHKLEYFLNARIIGSRIRTRAWELMLVMLAMEATFGIPGLIAAPIFYAYLKDELISRGLV